MTYDICYSLRGDTWQCRHAATVQTEAEAFAAARALETVPGVIHYSIHAEDGRTLWDTERDDLLPGDRYES
jgi:hypothetical protein